MGNCTLNAKTRIRSPAFAATLIEVVVVMGVVAILISISMPAIQAAREAARRTDCTNRVRQLILGASQFADRQRHLPSNGGPPDVLDGNSPYLDRFGSPFIPSTTDLTDWSYHPWGMGDNTLSPRTQTGSWGYAILGELELSSVLESDDREASLGIFHCPSRNRWTATTTMDDDQGLYRDGSWAMSKTDYCMNDRIATVQPDVRKWSHVSDGLSQTLFIGEKALDPTIQTPTSWYWDEPVWMGGSKGTARGGYLVLQDGVGITFRENWGSAHGAGAVFAFGDGGTHFVTESVDAAIMKAWITPAGSETAESPP